MDVQIDGYLGEAIDYIKEGQAKGANWKFLVDQIRYNMDANQYQTWRGEFWGKILRGACWLYQYSKDEELYAMLERTVRDFLSTQEENGRISSLPVDQEFTAQGKNKCYDLWDRKYMLLGLQYFYEICQDEQLKAYILKGMCISADYIISKVGPNPGQVDILEPIDTLGGSATSSILEPYVYLYKMTGYQRYLDFAEYVIESGGSSKVNFFEAAYKNDKSPFQFANGSGHAYSYTSCFEGLAEYALLTGNEKWMQAVKNYADWIIKDEITILGSGSVREHWSNTALSQNDPGTPYLQETCASVTWMKFCEKMLMITGDSTYADQIEKTAYNALLGAIQGPEANADDACSALYWDHFTLYNGTRHHEYGGHIVGVDSCCSAAGISGMGVIPLAQIMNSAEGPVINLYSPGSMAADTPSGGRVKFDVNTKYPIEGDIYMTVRPDAAEEFTVRMRIPNWCEQPIVLVNGTPQDNVVPGKYLELNRTWNPGDTIKLKMELRTKVIESSKGAGSKTEGNIALVRGPIVLARNARFQDGIITDGSNVKIDAEGYADVTLSDTQSFNNNMEFIVHKTDGTSFRMTDYPSAGNSWVDEYATCLYKVEPIELKEDTEYVLMCISDNSFVTLNDQTGALYRNPDFSAENSYQSWKLEKSGGSYYIKNASNGNYLTIAEDKDGAAITAKPETSANALWNTANKNYDTFTIAADNGGKLLSGAGGGSNAVHLWHNGDSALQYFKFIEKASIKPVELKENTPYTITCKSDNALVTLDEPTGNVFRTTEAADNEQPQTWTVEFQDDATYLKNAATGQYVTMEGNVNGSNVFAANEKTDSSRWNVKNKIANEFVLSDFTSGRLMSASGGGSDNILLWSSGGDMQIWKFVEKTTEPPTPDKSKLEALYGDWADIDLSLYSDGTAKENFKKALSSAKDVLDQPDATQEQIDRAFNELQNTSQQLELKPQTGDKEILRRVIEYAKEQKKEGGEYHNAIESVQISYDAALLHAEQVCANPTATDSDIQSAWTSLMTEIHKLGFIRGDKASLAKLIAAAEEFFKGIELYTEDTAQPFTAALTAAKGTNEDGDALTSDVAAAEKNLFDAMIHLRYKADKSILEKVLSKASQIDVAGYTSESVAVFNEANNRAKSVYDNANATQAEIKQAIDNLNAAIDGLVPNPDGGKGTALQGDNSLSTRSGNAKTGDTAPIAMALSVLVMAGAGFVLNRKKK